MAIRMDNQSWTSSTTGNKEALWSKLQNTIEVSGKEALFGADVPTFILQTRERERNEIQDLNRLLDAFIKKVGVLDLSRRDIRQRTFDVEADIRIIREDHRVRIADIRKRLIDATGEKATLESRIEQLKIDTEFYRRESELSYPEGNVDELTRKINETKVTLEKVRRESETLEAGIRKLMDENARLEETLTTVRLDLTRERKNRLDFFNQKDILIKKNEFLRKEFHFSISDQQSIGPGPVRPESYVDCHEIATAVQDILSEFDKWSRENQTKFEALRKIKIDEFYATERIAFEEKRKFLELEIEKYRNLSKNGRLQFEELMVEFNKLNVQLNAEKDRHLSVVQNLHGKIQLLLQENVQLQSSVKVLINTNQTLKAEIEIYRKMISGRRVERRTAITPDPVILRQTDTSHIENEVIETRIVATRSHTNIGFGTIPPNGEYIEIKNFETNEKDISLWKVRIRIDGLTRQPDDFVFPRNTRFSKFVTIWNADKYPNETHVFKCVLWGGQTTLKCYLLNERDEEKATYERKWEGRREINGITQNY